MIKVLNMQKVFINEKSLWRQNAENWKMFSLFKKLNFMKIMIMKWKSWSKFWNCRMSPSTKKRKNLFGSLRHLLQLIELFFKYADKRVPANFLIILLENQWLKRTAAFCPLQNEPVEIMCKVEKDEKLTADFVSEIWNLLHIKFSINWCTPSEWSWFTK